MRFGEVLHMLGHGNVTAESLAHVLAQSTDCVKLIDTGGRLLWMNQNGQCAMEIDDFSTVVGKPWISLWPQSAQSIIIRACDEAHKNQSSRFQAFCPTAKGGDRWWDVSVTALTDPQGLFSGYLSVSRDMTSSELAKQALNVAASEMRHRLGNSYAIIDSLITSHSRGSDELRQFASEMSDRISTLARAQTLFHDGRASCRLQELIPALMQPFERLDTVIELDIVADTPVDQSGADTIALIIGELSVNSNKHGAIAHGGRIAVEVRLQGAITVRWEENSTKEVGRQTREGGQGLKLIERVAKARRGSFGLEWKSSGLIASLWLPLAA
jgi:two-component sensor histidine kinase